MAVNPLSKPLHTEYKPLGLEAFAQPLSDMQAKFDTTKSAIDAADFAMSRLDQDDPRSKELLKEIEAKRDELAKNLMTTGNYRQAADKLVELNKVYNKDAETLAIQGNYKSYQEGAKYMRDLVDKGKITEADYKRWDFRAKDMFQGTKYDKEKDDYTSINVSPLMENKEKEILDLSLKIAGMAPTERVEYLGQFGAIDPFTKQAISTTVETRSLPKVAGEIERFLRNSDQFKDWNQQDADLKWYYNTKHDETYKDNFVGNYLNKIEDEANYYKKLMDSNSATAADKAEAKKLYESKTTELNNAVDELEQSEQEGTYDQYAQELFRKNNDKRFEQIGYTASDIVDLRSVSQDREIQEDTEGKKAVTAKLEKLKTMTVVTNTSESRGAAEEQTTTGGATSSLDENAKFNNNRETFESLQAHTVEKDDPTLHARIQTIADPAIRKITEESAQASIDLSMFLTRRGNHIKNIDDTEVLIKEQLAEQQKATTDAKKAEIQAKIVALQKTKDAAETSYTNESAILDNIIEAELTASYIPTSARDTYKTLYEKSPEALLDHLLSNKESTIGQTNTQLREGYLTPETQAQLMNTYYEEHSDGQRQSPQREAYWDKTLKQIEDSKKGPTYEKDTVYTGDEFARNISKKYRWVAKASFNTVGTEVVIDDGSNNLTDGKLKELTTYIANNQRGSSDIVKYSKFNTLTGEATTDPSGNEFNLANYETDPHFAGSDADGNLVFRYILKADYDVSTGKSRGPIADAIKTEKGIGEKEPFLAKDAEIQAWLKKNPTNLYVGVAGTSHNPALHAEKNYVDIAEAATMLNKPEEMTANVQNYAPFHMLQNADRRKAYFKLAAGLQDAVQNDHKSTQYIQGTAVWNPNEDGSYTGYKITYTVDNGEVLAKINQATMRDGKVTYTEVGSKTLNSEFNNLSTALVSMDLIYGTGREEDVVYQQQGFNSVPFVPAFINPQTFLNK